MEAPFFKKTELWYSSSNGILVFFILLHVTKRPLLVIGFWNICFGLGIIATPHPLHEIEQHEIERPSGECQH